MYEEQQKKTKMVSVINDLTSIKKQLHLLMSPISEERTNDSVLKSTNPQCRQHTTHQLEAQRSDRFLHFHNPQQKTIKQSPRTKYGRNDFTEQSKKCVARQSPKKAEKQVVAPYKKKQQQRKKYSTPLNKTSENQNSNQKLKFLPKDNRSKPIKNAFIDLVARAAIEEEKITKKQKQFSHFRHSSQRDLGPGNNCPDINLANNSKMQKQFINQQKIQQKQFFLLKKNVNITNTTPQNIKEKRLRRMKSDLIDHSYGVKNCIPEQIELQGNAHQQIDTKGKLIILQKQNAQKQGIIRILETELKQIQSAFIEMKLSIAKIIKFGSSSHKNIKEYELNEALAQVIKDLQLQKQQIKRLTIDSQTWRKLNFQQSLLIKAKQQQLNKYRKINETINELQQQNNRYKDQLINIASKLQVSNNQNRIKDQFIIKFLIGKSNTSKDTKIQSIIHILQSYLKSCSYPNNKLMQKLNEEQIQIKKLRAIIEKDRKNSI